MQRGSQSRPVLTECQVLIASCQLQTLAGTREFRPITDRSRLNPPANSAAFCNSQVVIILQIEPELCGQTEILPQADGSVSADGPVSADDFIDAGESEGLRQLIRTHAHGLHELGLENFSRVDRKDLS